MKRILLLEDDTSLAYGMKVALENNGYYVAHVSTIKEARTESKNDLFDLYLFDCILPDGNSFELFNELKSINSTPAVFLSALDDEVNIVTGLNIGGDDYITKPFKLAELISRINAVLRRVNKTHITSLSSKEIILDIEQMKLSKSGTLIDITITEFKILRLLMENAQSIVSKDDLFYKVWDIDSNFVDENTLAVNIRRLRNKMEDDSSSPMYIKTVRGVGYVWDLGCEKR